MCTNRTLRTVSNIDIVTCFCKSNMARKWLPNTCNPRCGRVKPMPCYSFMCLTMEAQVRSQPSLYGLYGGQSGSGIGFCLSTSVSPCQYHSSIAPYSFLIRLPPTVHNLSNWQRPYVKHFATLVIHVDGGYKQVFERRVQPWQVSLSCWTTFMYIFIYDFVIISKDIVRLDIIQ
jgi:hypothetical protein